MIPFLSLSMPHQARQSWERDPNDMRFKRLQHLLQKSNIYSKFLLTKMEQQQNEVGHREEVGGAAGAECAAVTCFSPAQLLSQRLTAVLSMLSGEGQEGENREEDQEGEN